MTNLRRAIFDWDVILGVTCAFCQNYTSVQVDLLGRPEKLFSEGSVTTQCQHCGGILVLNQDDFATHYLSNDQRERPLAPRPAFSPAINFILR